MSKYMRKYLGVAVALAVVGFAFLNINPYRITENEPRSPGLSLPKLSFSLPSLGLPGINNDASDPVVGAEAFLVFSQYLNFARTHNLEGVRSVSYRLSGACTDPVQEAECFRLMDSLAFFAEGFTAEEFKHVSSDDKQVIIYTDGPLVKLIYFTKDAAKKLKVLGLRLCEESEVEGELSCAELNVDTGDNDNDGWWNSTEELFK